MSPTLADCLKDAHALGNIELQTYTPSRVVAAQAMGMRYPNIGDEALEQFNRTGVYPSAMLDTLIVLWLCTLTKPEEVRRAMRRPDESIEKAIAWGAEHGVVDQKSKEFWDAYNKFSEIVTEVQNSKSVPNESSPHDSTETQKKT